MKENDAHRRARLGRFFSFLQILIRPLIRPLFRFRGERVPAVNGPILLLCNHNTDLDCVMIGTVLPGYASYVATESIARMGLLGKLLMRWFDPILHYKGSQGARTTLSILKRIRDGVSVVLFPEGNRSFNGQTCPIPPATGKMARVSGATLVTYLISGGYFSSPRWGKGFRRGEMTGRVMGVYPPETLKAMKAEEVQAAVERDLWTDAYEEQKQHPVRFRSRKRAEALESFLLSCPRCGRIGSLRSHKTQVSCACGYRATFTEAGMLRDDDGTEHTLTELDKAQRLALEQLVAEKGEDLLFSDSVTFRQVGEDHQASGESQITLAAYGDRFLIGERSVPMDDIDAISVIQRNRLLFRPAEGSVHWEFTGPPSFNALKYLYLFRITHPSVNGVL